MTDVSRRKRQPKGAPASAGGEFAGNSHDEAVGGLDAKGMELRTKALRFGKHVKALSTVQMPTDPNTWWDRQYMQGEYEGTGSEGSFPKMPDDNTPSKLSGNEIAGRSMSGSLRTYRRRYVGENGVEVRMPSVASINRYAKETGGTFDVPVTATRPNGSTISGWVRVTNTGKGQWNVTPVGLTGDDSAERSDAFVVPEIVGAVLESRSPRSSLQGIRDFAQRRRERNDVRGIRVEKVEHSSFITGISYDPNSQVAAVQIGNRQGEVKTYGYAGVTPERYLEFRGSSSIGSAYSRLLKNDPSIPASFQIPTCEKCGNMYPPGATHRCPESDRHTRRTQGMGADFNQRARERAAERASR